MDPIHPIVPVTERIPVVTSVPRVERSPRRRGDDEGDGGARRGDSGQFEPDDLDDADAVHVDLHDDEDGEDFRPHVDITV